MASHIGEVYYIRNTVNGKGYIGQALKTVGRWLSHLREARDVLKGKKDHCVLLNNAINKYGGEAFEVLKLCDCTSTTEMDEMETKFIHEYNTKVPNGYNLTSGGGKGLDSEETREKKRQMRLGKTHAEDTKKKISTSQVGNRRTTKKYPEDANLPKFIVPKRLHGTIIGYVVQSFPKGNESTEYIKKTFNNSDTSVALKRACDFLNELYKMYPDVDCVTKKSKMNVKDHTSVERQGRVNKVGSDRYSMPKYVYLVYVDNQDIGFKVDGLRIINDDGTIRRHSKMFVNQSISMQEKLQSAIDHIEYMKAHYKCLIDEHVKPEDSLQSS